MTKPMDLKKNDQYIIDITDIGNEGEGIGKIDGFTFFVDKALPGEKVKIVATKLKKNYGYGKLLEIISPSPLRTEPMCPIAYKCGGCSLQHLSYKGQLAYKTNKVKQNLERIGGLKDVEFLPALGMDNPTRYRNKAQYPVSSVNGELVYGFYAKHSHRVVPCDDCLINDQYNKNILSAIKAFAEQNKISAYDEEKHTGILRHIVIKNASHTGQIMVCLVVNTNDFNYKHQLVDTLSHLDKIKSIVVSYNTNKTNVILSNCIEVIYGGNTICDTIGDLKFNISPLSFFQVNPVQTEVLYKTALDFANLKGDEVVIDAYCGIGTISLFLAQKAKKVYGVEIVPEAIEAAKENARLNNITNAEFYVGKSEDIVPQLYNEQNVQPDVIVVDPPRKGCEASLLNLMLDIKPEKVVYVSCDSATLARDLKILCEDKYTVRKVQPVDMFPQTGHVETVVLMSRVDK